VTLWRAIEPLLFWNFRRGSWQYDLVVAAILFFIFATPRAWFSDSPRPRTVVLVRMEGPVSEFWLDAQTLAQWPEQRWNAEVTRLIEAQAKLKVRGLEITRVDDGEGGVRGYLARAHRQ
jgi:hypothetical protein